MVSGYHLKMAFFYLFTSSLLKSKSRQASSLTEVHCIREEKVVMISKALRKMTCQWPQNATGLSVVANFFFSPVNSHLQIALLNPEAFPNFQNTLILQQQIQSIIPGEKDSLLMAIQNQH